MPSMSLALAIWFAGVALVVALVLGALARKNLQFSLLSLLAATAVTGAMLALMTRMAILSEGSPARLALLCVGALLWQAAGLAAASLVRPRLALGPTGAGVLSWLSGMALAWVCALMMAMLALV
jgi:hypothetical protein